MATLVQLIKAISSA